MAYKDPEAQRRYNRAWYQKTGRRSVLTEQRVARRQVARDLVRRLKEQTPCADCRAHYPYYVMDFDHLRDKRRHVSLLVGEGYSLEAVRVEIGKCEIVCSNCHRIRSWNRRQKIIGV